jgi:hypothetical protein
VRECGPQAMEGVEPLEMQYRGLETRGNGAFPSSQIKQARTEQSRAESRRDESQEQTKIGSFPRWRTIRKSLGAGINLPSSLRC